METKLSKAVAQKVLDVVDQGLVRGLGDPTPGKMCVEAAVCYALGEPHNDAPSCVGRAVCRFKIILNDAQWSSNAARAAGMRRVAIAQLGSKDIDQSEFATRVTIDVIKKILPIALRAAAKMRPQFAEVLEGCAVVCEAVTDLASARAAASSAKNETRRVAYAAAYAAYAAADAYAAYAAADAAAYAAADAYAAYAAYAAADAAADAAYAAADASADASDAARKATRDSVLGKAAEIAVEVLIAMKCEGTKWLGLTEQK